MTDLEDRQQSERMRVFQCFFNFLGWHCFSLGVHVGLDGPHLDLHLPGGFARIGWVRWKVRAPAVTFGWDGLDWSQEK